MVVNSLVTNLHEGSVLQAGKPAAVRAHGLGRGAMAYGTSKYRPMAGKLAARRVGAGPGALLLETVEVRHYRSASGDYTVMAKATNRVGASQSFELVFNPAGYHNNVVQRILVSIA
jgi:hypothetical protein